MFDFTSALTFAKMQAGVRGIRGRASPFIFSEYLNKSIN